MKLPSTPRSERGLIEEDDMMETVFTRGLGEVDKELAAAGVITW
ncbi:hypothetical protein ACQP1W_31700 [Spirillospora sp. CA-255316]